MGESLDINKAGVPGYICDLVDMVRLTPDYNQ